MPIVRLPLIGELLAFLLVIVGLAWVADTSRCQRLDQTAGHSGIELVPLRRGRPFVGSWEGFARVGGDMAGVDGGRRKAER